MFFQVLFPHDSGLYIKLDQYLQSSALRQSPQHHQAYSGSRYAKTNVSRHARASANPIPYATTLRFADSNASLSRLRLRLGILWLDHSSLRSLKGRLRANRLRQGIRSESLPSYLVLVSSGQDVHCDIVLRQQLVEVLKGHFKKYSNDIVNI
jgi:hypothetical protein